MPGLYLSKARVCVCFCVLGAGAPAMAYEDAPKIHLADILPPELIQSFRHRIEEVEVRRGTLHFYLESDFGAYQIAGMGLLRERIRETLIVANAINQFDRRETGAPDARSGQLEIRSDEALDIISRPVSTAANLAEQLAENLGETLLGPARPVPREFIYAGGESADPVTALHKRNAAGQWQLDVYSTNPKVQEFLDAVARARSAGTISAGTPNLNRQPVKPLRIADPALDAELSAQLKSKGPAELQVLNEPVLAGLGIPAESRSGFLQHAVLSPRHKTRISHYLYRLAGVANLTAFIGAAVTSREEEEALAYEHLAMMLAHYHQRGNPLKELLPGGAGGRPHVDAVTGNGQLVRFIVQDLIYWNENTERRFLSLLDRSGQAGVAGRLVITSGSMTAEARAQLRSRGFELEEEYIYN